MNIDRELVTRALARAGQEPLNDEDIIKNSTRWRAIKAFYLSTILETLSQTSWTSRKRRAVLEEVMPESEMENNTGYMHCYRLPADCAKPEALKEDDEFIVEGDFLFTDSEVPVLLYISNGKRTEVKLPENEDKPEEELPDEEDNVPEDKTEEPSESSEEDTDETGEEIVMALDDPEEDEEIEEDYPDYDNITFEPLLSQYLETRLAAKIVLKITGDLSLYNTLYNESLMCEQRALEASEAHSKSRLNGNKWWADQIGLGGANAYH